jgi:hypothetical protein
MHTRFSVLLNLSVRGATNVRVDILAGATLSISYIEAKSLLKPATFNSVFAPVY